MDVKQYAEMQRKYQTKYEERAKVLAREAFWEFDAQVHEYDLNGESAFSDGRDLIEGVSPEDVVEIIDEYLERLDEQIADIRDEVMRDAIQAVTGIIY